ncbi:thioredoxin family protein [Aneurinibacillus uraniidurans]|uniref:thioredoxin family protein n=1 Tax=Aneurinibacillus uraniidurans TaxID=2966586 RepID=UPI00234A0947|nr:thioredoxin family protein [Aneurinibacillus sp. B1]WCN37425.1 thioredoxin family protein [Aneurinibacillus sp. B1]
MDECTELSEIKAHIERHEISLVFIKMANCGVCDVVFEKTERLLQKYPRVKSVAVSIEKTPAIAGEFLVFTAPTILLFLHGKEVLRQSRFVRFEQLEEALDRTESM